MRRLLIRYPLCAIALVVVLWWSVSGITILLGIWLHVDWLAWLGILLWAVPKLLLAALYHIGVAVETVTRWFEWLRR